MKFQYQEDHDGRIEITDQHAIGEVVAVMGDCLPMPRKRRLAMLLSATPYFAAACKAIAEDPRVLALSELTRAKLFTAIYAAGLLPTPTPEPIFRGESR